MTVLFVNCFISTLLPCLFCIIRERIVLLNKFSSLVTGKFSPKGQTVNIFGFAGRMVSVRGTQLCRCKARAARRNAPTRVAVLQNRLIYGHWNMKFTWCLLVKRYYSAFFKILTVTVLERESLKISNMSTFSEWAHYIFLVSLVDMVQKPWPSPSAVCLWIKYLTSLGLFHVSLKLWIGWSSWSPQDGMLVIHRHDPVCWVTEPQCPGLCHLLDISDITLDNK